MKYCFTFAIQVLFLFTFVNGQQLEFSFTNVVAPGIRPDPIPDEDTGNIGKYFYTKEGAYIRGITAMYDVQGTPQQEVMITWYFNGQEIEFDLNPSLNIPPGAGLFSTRQSLTVFDQDSNRVFADTNRGTQRTTTLYIPDVDPVHAGNYTVVVSSGNSNAAATSFVFVGDPPVLIPTPPDNRDPDQPNETPLDLASDNGFDTCEKTFVYYATFRGDPKPDVTCTDSRNSGTQEEQPNDSATERSVKYSLGPFPQNLVVMVTCVGTNSIGTATQTREITTFGSLPRLSAISPVTPSPCTGAIDTPTVVENERACGKEGSGQITITHTLSANGSPAATIRWFHRNNTGVVREVSSGGRYNINRSGLRQILQIQRPTTEDEGEYYITAENCAGTISTNDRRTFVNVNVGESCSQFPVDICFVIDGSGSLGQAAYDSEINFIIGIANQPTSPSTRFCYSIFNSAVVSHLPLTGDHDQFRASLAAEPYQGGGTNLLVALSHADSTLLTNENRLDNRRRILFFLTDGTDSSTAENLRSVSSSLSRKRVDTVAIGFGSSVDMAQLMAIGLSQSFVFSNFDEAQQRIGNITSLICQAPPSCCLGPSGRRGPVGMKGFPGSTGGDGVPGICVTLEECFGYSATSPKGATGPSGPPGGAGVAGPLGSSGAKGEDGDRGITGAGGTKGFKGFKGDGGAIGSAGNRGEDGVKGGRGTTGPQGAKGELGLKGSKGESGSIGVCRSDSCTGEKGAQGIAGVDGPKGESGTSGSKGDNGLTGLKGSSGGAGDTGLTGQQGQDGEAGEAIEKKTFVEEVCSPSGSLYFDPPTKRLYYCEKGRYLCVSSNGSCDGTEECLCTVSSSAGIPCGQFTRNTGSEICGRNVAVDFILVVDDTSSMDRQQSWLRLYLPQLENALTSRCIGKQPNLDQPIMNLYQIVAYGARDFPPGTIQGREYAGGRPPHFVLDGSDVADQFSPPVSDPTFTIDRIEEVTDNLQNIGGFGQTGNNEDGYEALEYALRNAALRNNTDAITYIPVMILLTNGDADDYSSSKYAELLSEFKRRTNMVFAFALNVGNFTSTNNLLNLFGVANNFEGGDLAAWYIPSETSAATLQNVTYGSITSDVSPRITVNTEYRNVGRDYINLLMCSMRSSASFWDLDFVVNGDAEDVRRFTDAFIQQNAEAIISRAQSFSCRFCYCSLSANEVCAILDEEQLCGCLQDNPPSECSCVQSMLQALVEPATETFTPSTTQVQNILTSCNLVSTPPTSGDCTSYINYINV